MQNDLMFVIWLLIFQNITSWKFCHKWLLLPQLCVTFNCVTYLVKHQGISNTVIREMFVGTIFSWGKSTTKIKRTKVFIRWKIATTKHITRGWHTACSYSLVRSYFKPANGLPDTKGSMALSSGISSASAASHTSLYIDGNHEYRCLVWIPP